MQGAPLRNECPPGTIREDHCRPQRLIILAHATSRPSGSATTTDRPTWPPGWFKARALQTARLARSPPGRHDHDSRCHQRPTCGCMPGRWADRTVLCLSATRVHGSNLCRIPGRRRRAAIAYTYRAACLAVPHTLSWSRGRGSGTGFRVFDTTYLGSLVRGLTASGFGIPIAAYVWFLHHYSLNVVRSDQWSDVTLITKSYDGQLTLSALWAQHAENRILFPNLIVLAMSRIDAFNISVEEYVSASCFRRQLR